MILRAMILLVLVFMLLSCDSDSPVSPNKVGQLPGGNTYTAIEFINAENGWVVGNGGLIYMTTNGGETWSKQDIATNDNLYKIDFVDEIHGWIASDNAGWHTNDGGTSWVQQLVDSSLSIFVDMIFIDRNTGWVSGSPGGIIYHTSDSGQSWSLQAADTPGRIVGLSFVSVDRGWSVGASSEVFRTTNGGLAWTEINSPRFSHSIFFIDSLVGFVGNITWASSVYEDYSDIFKTVNGGNTWTTQVIPQTTSVHEISFIDSEYGFAIIGGGIYTTNGGEEWKPVLNLPANQSYPDFSILSGGDVYILSSSGDVYRYAIR
jgi:photosystem II stability/assembly factor-like uncharacterized protein